MALLPGYKANFETLQRASDVGDLALMECTDKATGLPVAVVCAVNRVNGEFEFAPLAKLFDGNPYDELLPPDQGHPATAP
jgi:hypothetical protein